MQENSLAIKNMVCQRCISAVQRIMRHIGRPTAQVTLGKVMTNTPLTASEKEQLSQALSSEGFEILDDRKSQLISCIKSTLIRFIHYEDLSNLTTNLSDYLSETLHKDYSTLSKIFSESENLTIEKFIIQQKIEKVKEMLVYDQLSLKEIAFQMGYSSSAHLSSQFKKVTGFSPSAFKKLKNHKRRFLDDL